MPDEWWEQPLPDQPQALPLDLGDDAWEPVAEVGPVEPVVGADPPDGDVLGHSAAHGRDDAAGEPGTEGASGYDGSTDELLGQLASRSDDPLLQDLVERLRAARDHGAT
jgi:hypothetical protein